VPAAGPNARRSLAAAVAALAEGGRADLRSQEGDCHVALRRDDAGLHVEVVAATRITQTDVVSFGRQGWKYLGERRFQRTFEPGDDVGRVAGEVAGFAADRLGEDPGPFAVPVRPAPGAPAAPRTRAPARAAGGSGRAAPRKAPAPARPKGPEERLCPSCFLRRPVDQFTPAGTCRDCQD
jgi:hypothetical protein